MTSLTSLKVCNNFKSHDIREGNVIIRSEIEFENIRSLGFQDFRGVTFKEVDNMEFRIYKHKFIYAFVFNVF